MTGWKLSQPLEGATPFADVARSAGLRWSGTFELRRKLAMRKDPREILEYARTVAVVGASRDANKPGGSVPAALQEHGFKVFPINPTAEVLFGEPVYRSLRDLPHSVDVVQVFRPAEEAPEIARQAVAIGARALWLQLGIRSDEARRIAEEAALDYVEDRCMGEERARYRIDKRAAA
jgi:predicted CoA-binding protein